MFEAGVCRVYISHLLQDRGEALVVADERNYGSLLH